MDSHRTTGATRLPASALQAARGAETLAAYLGTCPTCLGFDDPASESCEREPRPGRAACPTCGLCSVEWDLAVAMSAELRGLTGLERLDVAIGADNPAPERA